MKRLVLIAVLVLGSIGAAVAQTAAPAGGAAVAPAQPVQVPLPDEKTLTISDTPGAAQAAPAGPSGDVGIWDFVKMFLVLALVIGMILGFLWFMRRLSGQGPGSDAPIKVLHTHNLGGNRHLQVVEVAGEVLLLSTADGGVRLLKDLTGTEAADAFRLAASQTKAQGSAAGFSDLLGNLLGRKPKIRPDVAQPVDKSSDFLKKQRERLKNL